jgi:hypothetical protein
LNTDLKNNLKILNIWQQNWFKGRGPFMIEKIPHTNYTSL